MGEQEKRTKKGIFLVFISGLFLLSFPSIILAEIHTTQSVSGVYYHVSGNTSRSFYPTNEADYLYEGSVDFKNSIFNNGYELFGSINYRSTNDKLVDKQEFSVERMYLGLKGQAKEMLLGDFYSSFSEYTLGNAIKGGKLVLGDEKSSRLTLVGGIDTSRWEDLWESRQEDSATRRFVWGSRLENNFLNNKLAVNFNYGGADDDIAYISASSVPMLVNVFSLDGKYDLNRYFTLSSEIAQSFTNEDTRKSSSDQGIKGDRAMKFGVDFKLPDYTLNSLYSRIGKHFNTTGGFSAQDLETMAFNGMWFMPLKVKFSHYLRMDKDNLSKTATTTTRQLNPGGKFTFSLPFAVSMDLGADFRKRFSTDKSTNERTLTYTSNLGKDFKILYSSFGYTKTIVTNKVTAEQERKTDTYTLNLDGAFNIKNVNFSWNLGENIDRTYYLEAEKADFVNSTTLGTKLKFPSSLMFEASATLGDNNYYINETDSKNRRYYFAVSRDLMKDNLTFNASYEHKGYRYFAGDNNFAETFIRARLDYKF